ncbi:hypothetical protein OQA88_3625 [Cercophora sp. LCS_1]
MEARRRPVADDDPPQSDSSDEEPTRMLGMHPVQFTKKSSPTKRESSKTIRSSRTKREVSNEPETRSAPGREKRSAREKSQVKKEPPADDSVGGKPRSESSASQKRKAREIEEDMSREFIKEDDRWADGGKKKSSDGSKYSSKPRSQYRDSKKAKMSQEEETTPSPKKPKLKVPQSTGSAALSSPRPAAARSKIQALLSESEESLSPRPMSTRFKLNVPQPLDPKTASPSRPPFKEPMGITSRQTGKVSASKQLKAAIQEKRMKLATQVEISPEATQRPQFKMYGLDLDDDDSPLRLDRISISPPRSPILTSSRNACPMCGEEVNQTLLENFKRKHPRMTLHVEQKFCLHHKKTSAKETWLESGYPDINWGTLEKRIAEQHGYLKSILQGTKCYYGDMFSQKIKSGQNKTMLKSEENPTPGYYGTRGFRVMSEIIVSNFSSLLRKRAVQDRLVSARGHTAYVQAVLVPELAVQLIKEDMSVGAEEARSIMNESVWVGELLNEEVADVVLSDGDNDDDDDKSLTELSSISEPESP